MNDCSLGKRNGPQPSPARATNRSGANIQIIKPVAQKMRSPILSVSPGFTIVTAESS